MKSLKEIADEIFESAADSRPFFAYVGEKEAERLGLKDGQIVSGVQIIVVPIPKVEEVQP